jgi:hypothetical protein
MVVAFLFQWFIKAVASVMVFLLSGFGEFRPERSLVEGRVIPWSDVLWAALKLGLIWCGLALGLGYLFFRKRELAVYSGQS